MFEKDMKVGLLLDFYGDVLSEHSRSILERYYSDDLSLGEIAEEVGISRQGVWQIIKKGGEELRFLEEHLGLAAQFRSIHESAQKLIAISEELRAIGGEANTRLAGEVRKCAEDIIGRQ